MRVSVCQPTMMKNEGPVEFIVQVSENNGARNLSWEGRR